MSALVLIKREISVSSHILAIFSRLRHDQGFFPFLLVNEAVLFLQFYGFYSFIREKVLHHLVLHLQQGVTMWCESRWLIAWLRQVLLLRTLVLGCWFQTQLVSKVHWSKGRKLFLEDPQEPPGLLRHMSQICAGFFFWMEMPGGPSSGTYPTLSRLLSTLRCSKKQKGRKGNQYLDRNISRQDTSTPSLEPSLVPVLKDEDHCPRFPGTDVLGTLERRASQDRSRTFRDLERSSSISG